ncbi:MAG: phasin family protein [Fibrobacterota bacterium]
MGNFIKDAFLAGIGMGVTAGERLEKAARDISHSADMSKEEGEKFYEELKTRSEEASQKMEERINTVVSQQLKKMNIPERGKVDQLEGRIAALEAELEKLRQSE